jgi:hypothetical protein
MDELGSYDKTKAVRKLVGSAMKSVGILESSLFQPSTQANGRRTIHWQQVQTLWNKKLCIYPVSYPVTGSSFHVGIACVSAHQRQGTS